MSLHCLENLLCSCSGSFTRGGYRHWRQQPGVLEHIGGTAFWVKIPPRSSMFRYSPESARHLLTRLLFLSSNVSISGAPSSFTHSRQRQASSRKTWFPAAAVAAAMTVGPSHRALVFLQPCAPVHIASARSASRPSSYPDRCRFLPSPLYFAPPLYPYLPIVVATAAAAGTDSGLLNGRCGPWPVQGPLAKFSLPCLAVPGRYGRTTAAQKSMRGTFWGSYNANPCDIPHH